MRTFEQWFTEAGVTKESSDDGIQDLPDGVTEWDGAFYAACCVCGIDDVIDVDLIELPRTGYQHYCNRGPGCQP